MAFSSEPENAVHDAVVLVELKVDGFIGYVPFADVSHNNHLPDSKDALLFRTSDIRDIIALAQSELASSIEQEGWVEYEGFSFDDFHISQPFLAGDYWDYNLDSDGQLLNPVQEYGDTYIQWRDEFAERIRQRRTPQP